MTPNNMKTDLETPDPNLGLPTPQLVAAANTLYNTLMCDERHHSSFTHHVMQLVQVMNRVAESVTRETARFHDDPEAEDYAENHAPADVQYPLVVRKQAIKDLVKYFLTELRDIDIYV